MSSKVSEIAKAGCAQLCAEPTVLRLNTPEFHGIFTEGLKTVLKLFESNDFQIRLCGGAVRDLLSGKAPKDLDFATTATPEEMIQMFNKHEIRLISESGWSHGTVTCRVAEQNFEITTLRIDRVTDGRHAKVEYTKNWMLDASRRDLTINSLYMTFEGDVIDYFNGKEDLENQQIRFVGDPDERIKEDYLRILRYFRFFGRIAHEDTQHDEKTLEIISENANGLLNVSGERIWVELILILKGRLVPQILSTMFSCKLFPYIGLPEFPNMGRFAEIWKCLSHLSPHHVTALAALFESTESVDHFRKRIKCSNVEHMILEFIVQHRHDIKSGSGRLDHYLDILVDLHRKRKPALPAFYEFLKYTGDTEAMDYCTHIKIPVFPVSGNLVKEKCCLKGKLVGKALDYLFIQWKNSRYRLSGPELLDMVNETTNWDGLV